MVNQARSNYRYNIVQPTTIFYGCAISIDKQARKVEPADSVKGIVARANLFMADHYAIRLSDQQRQLFTAWNKLFPPSAWEKEWSAHVAQIEGYSNPYIY